MNMHFLLADSGIGGLFTALGVDLKTLLLNAAAFLVVVWIMGRFVYPHLIKALDNKKAELEAATREQKAAAAALEKANQEAAEILAQARAAADEVVVLARDEAATLAKSTEDKAAAQAERIVTEAREQLAKDVAAARKSLKAETAKLVVQATEAVLAEKLDDKRDAELVTRALEGR
jgi:F-type H+-transporting ATPase subunit b